MRNLSIVTFDTESVRFTSVYEFEEMCAAAILFLRCTAVAFVYIVFGGKVMEHVEISFQIQRNAKVRKLRIGLG